MQTLLQGRLPHGQRPIFKHGFPPRLACCAQAVSVSSCGGLPCPPQPGSGRCPSCPRAGSFLCLCLCHRPLLIRGLESLGSLSRCSDAREGGQLCRRRPRSSQGSHSLRGLSTAGPPLACGSLEHALLPWSFPETGDATCGQSRTIRAGGDPVFSIALRWPTSGRGLWSRPGPGAAELPRGGELLWAGSLGPPYSLPKAAA